MQLLHDLLCMSTLLRRCRRCCRSIIYSPDSATLLILSNPTATKGQVCAYLKETASFSVAYSGFRVMIDGVIVCACETVCAMERRHSFAVGCVTMSKAFSAIESIK